MSDKAKLAKIEKFVIDIGGQKLELSPEQAKELRDILVDVLGAKSSDWEGLIPVPYPVYPRPWQYWEPVYYTTPTGNAPFWAGMYQITCKA